MKPKFFIVLNFFFPLSLFLLFGCASGQKAYDGPSLPPEQTARIICETKPHEIHSRFTRVSPYEVTRKSWRATSKTLAVLPGTYIIDFEILIPPYAFNQKTLVSHELTVEAGHNYRIKCYHTGVCNVTEF